MGVTMKESLGKKKKRGGGGGVEGGGDAESFRKSKPSSPLGANHPSNMEKGCWNNISPPPLPGTRKPTICEGGGAGTVKHIGYLEAKGTL